LRNYGQQNRYSHDRIGLNSRLDEVQAAVLNVRLPILAHSTRRRQAIAESYRTGISSDYVEMLVRPTRTENHVYHLFVVTSPFRDQLQQHCISAGVETLIHYPIPVHRQKPFEDLAGDPFGLRHSEEHADRCLSLPCRPNLSDNEISRVIEAINSFVP